MTWRVLLAFGVSAIALHSADENPTSAQPPGRESAEASVQVTLVSDNITWVSIANIQPPKKFGALKVSLPPGDYEVIGRRKGYRDVRELLRVRAASAPSSLRIVCKESNGSE